MSKNDGGPAFPAFDIYLQPDPDKSAYFPGMTLRDWFAGQALQGHLAYGYAPRNPDENWHQEISKEAYEIADAMLAARQSQEGEDE